MKLKIKIKRINNLNAEGAKYISDALIKLINLNILNINTNFPKIIFIIYFKVL